MALTKDAIIIAVAESNGYPRSQAIELVETLCSGELRDKINKTQ